MISPPTCAAPGCDNPVNRPPGQPGRPAIYCSAACRPSTRGPNLVVEVDRQDDFDHQPGRDWTVRLRRGRRAVTISEGLGLFSATDLATQIHDLLGGRIDTP